MKLCSEKCKNQKCYLGYIEPECWKGWIEAMIAVIRMSK